MSADGIIAGHRPQASGGYLITPKRGKGNSPNPSGLSKERREMQDAIESRCVPRVLAVLDELERRFMEEGNDFCGKLWLEQVRPAPKHRDSDDIERAVEDKLLELIQMERARRAAETK